MTPGGWVYFDHSQTKKEDSVTIGGYTTVQKVYGYEPVPAELSARRGKICSRRPGQCMERVYEQPEKGGVYDLSPHKRPQRGVMEPQRAKKLG